MKSEQSASAFEQYRARLAAVWDRKTQTVEWSEMENALVDTLSDHELTDAQRVLLVKETLDAYTLRGHFPELWTGADSRRIHNGYNLARCCQACVQYGAPASEPCEACGAYYFAYPVALRPYTGGAQ